MTAKRNRAGLFIARNVVTFETFDVQGNSPRSGEPLDRLSTAKKLRPVVGTADARSSGAVACAPTYKEEKNPATLRHRPPKLELPDSSPLD